MSAERPAIQAIQDRLFPHMQCFGCGPDNVDGLRLKSFADGSGRAVAEFLPWPAHNNGLGYLNGGIIATVLDCHSAAAVLDLAEERGWGALPGAALAYVTAGLDVSYLRPAPLDQLVSLVAEVQEASEDAITCAVRLEYDGKVRAEATALWKRWRAR
jgi:acyl-coenzyme A thioesterase PaaI-like protein